MLYLSRVAKEQGLPLNSEALVTDKEGQVKGLGVSVIKKILKEYDITRTLAEEAGRTSRGSHGFRSMALRWRMLRLKGAATFS